MVIIYDSDSDMTILYYDYTFPLVQVLCWCQYLFDRGSPEFWWKWEPLQPLYCCPTFVTNPGPRSSAILYYPLEAKISPINIHFVRCSPRQMWFVRALTNTHISAMTKVKSVNLCMYSFCYAIVTRKIQQISKRQFWGDTLRARKYRYLNRYPFKTIHFIAGENETKC